VDFNAAQSAFRRYDEPSFVDATIVAYLNRDGVEYLYSFDDDFDVVDGISRLGTAENPFSWVPFEMDGSVTPSVDDISGSRSGQYKPLRYRIKKQVVRYLRYPNTHYKSISYVP